MLKIRLMRQGAKKKPFYNLIAVESSRASVTWPLARLGFYNPMVAKTHKDRFTCNEDLIVKIINNGAQITDRVFYLLNKIGFFQKHNDKQISKIYNRYIARFEKIKNKIQESKPSDSPSK